MEERPTINNISVEQLAGHLRSDGQVLLLDPLPAARYQQKHLPGAANACVFEVTFVDQVAAIVPDKESPVVVYGVGHHTHDASTAAEKLLRAGYRQVSILEGGLSAWQSAGNLLEGASIDAIDPPNRSLTDGLYQIDSETSIIEWTGRNPGTAHWGTLRLSAGEVRVVAGEISGEFTIDMNSIDNRNLAGHELKPVLEKHLRSDDFFFVKLFPQAEFKMTASPVSVNDQVSFPNYQVRGQLKLRGISAEQSFPASVAQTDEGHLVAEAHFDIDRTRWGVIYGSTRFFEHLGMHLVLDQISLQVRIQSK